MSKAVIDFLNSNATASLVAFTMCPEAESFLVNGL